MRIVILGFLLGFYLSVFSQDSVNKINELKIIESVSIGNTGDFIDGAIDFFTNCKIKTNNISGNYSNYGGGDFSIIYNIKFSEGKFQIAKKEEGFDITGKLKSKIKVLKIISIDGNRIKTNEGLFIYSRYSKDDLLDLKNKIIKEGFIMIQESENHTGADFIWKQ